MVVSVSLQRLVYVLTLAAVSLWMVGLWLSFKLVRVEIFGPTAKKPARRQHQPQAIGRLAFNER